MKITRDNYEIFFLDYLEGDLEESLIDEFLDFLEQHPDLKEELQLFEDIHLTRETIAFPGKKQLYRSAAEERENFDLKVVALMEGDLKDEERQSLLAYLEAHPELKKQAALFEKTRLKADRSIHFPDKEKLYRGMKTRSLVKWLGRVAAVALLLWGFNALYQTQKDQTLGQRTEEIASLKTQDEEKKAQEMGRLDEGTKPQAQAQEKETGERKALTNLNSPKGPMGPMGHQGKAEEKETGNGRQETGEGKALADLSSPKGRQEKARAEEETMAKIAPIFALLETTDPEVVLTVSGSVRSEISNSPVNVMTVDQYLAKRAKKASQEGLLSAHRLIRAGLNVASELSGERIGYTVKEGKVASLDFESKLLAFSIPLEKK